MNWLIFCIFAIWMANKIDKGIEARRVEKEEQMQRHFDNLIDVIEKQNGR